MPRTTASRNTTRTQALTTRKRGTKQLTSSPTHSRVLRGRTTSAEGTPHVAALTAFERTWGPSCEA